MQPNLIELPYLPRTWADPILRASTAKALLKQPNHVLLAYGQESGKPPIEAYALIHIPPAAAADVLTLHTQPNFRHMGRARILMAEIITRAKAAGCTTLTLEVRASNNPAINLYQSLGFQQAHTRTAYYQSPVEDALVLTLDLTPQSL